MCSHGNTLIKVRFPGCYLNPTTCALNALNTILGFCLTLFPYRSREVSCAEYFYSQLAVGHFKTYLIYILGYSIKILFL